MSLAESAHGRGVENFGQRLRAEVSDGFAIVNRSGGGTEVRLRFALTSLPADQFDSSSASAAAPASPTFSTTT